MVVARAAFSSFSCLITTMFYNPGFMRPVCSSSPRREGKIIILIMNVRFNQHHLTLWELNFYLSLHTLNMGLYLLMQNRFAIILSFGSCHVNRGISPLLTAWSIICRSRLEVWIQPPRPAAAELFVCLSFFSLLTLSLSRILFGAAYWSVMPPTDGAYPKGMVVWGRNR